MNLFDDIPESSTEELFTELLHTKGVRIERIVSYGQRSEEGFWYDQEEGEWIVVLEDTATIEYESGEVVDLKAGDHQHIAPHCRHRVAETDKNERTVWLAIFYQNEQN